MRHNCQAISIVVPESRPNACITTMESVKVYVFTAKQLMLFIECIRLVILKLKIANIQKNHDIGLYAKGKNEIILPGGLLVSSSGSSRSLS